MKMDEKCNFSQMKIIKQRSIDKYYSRKLSREMRKRKLRRECNFKRQM
jgi:hypothetical protein